MMIRLTLRIFLLVMLFIGTIGIVLALACRGMSYLGIKMISDKIQFPLGEIEDLVVGGEGHIICYSGDHYRLQLYNNEGKFERGWFVDASCQKAKLVIDADNNINIATYNDIHYIFDMYGNLHKERVDSGIYNKYVLSKKGKEIKDINGNTYDYDIKGIRAKIYKTTHQGKKIAIITTPFYLWPFGLIPSFCFVIIPAVYLTIVRRKIHIKIYEIAKSKYSSLKSK